MKPGTSFKSSQTRASGLAHPLCVDLSSAAGAQLQLCSRFPRQILREASSSANECTASTLQTSNRGLRHHLVDVACALRARTLANSSGGAPILVLGHDIESIPVSCAASRTVGRAVNGEGHLGIGTDFIALGFLLGHIGTSAGCSEFTRSPRRATREYVEVRSPCIPNHRLNGCRSAAAARPDQ